MIPIPAKTGNQTQRNSVHDIDQVDTLITAKWNKLPVISYIALIFCAELL